MQTKTSKDAAHAAGAACLIYCRVSSERQAQEDKGSLEAQERTGRAKAGPRRPSPQGDGGLVEATAPTQE